VSTATPMSEEQLVERLKQGDEAALAEFVELKRLPLLSFIQKSTSDQLRRKIEPDDILQEVAMSAVGAIEEIELGDRDPFSWLCRLAERRIIDAHRRYFAQKRDAEKEVGLQAGSANGGGAGLIDVLVASMTSPSSAFKRGQREFALLEALAQLPEDNRLALQLRYVENLPSKEIAERLGRTDGATRVLLTRSLQKLHALLGENDLFESFQSR
jgi:RNA polymerase sigma-70 factor, ECF subfamily